MKAIARFILYLIILVLLYGGLTDPGAPLRNSTFVGQIAYYVAYYGITFGVPMLVFELIFRFTRWNVRSDRKMREKQKLGE